MWWPGCDNATTREYGHLSGIISAHSIMELACTRDDSSLDGEAQEFFNHIQDEQDADGEDYPYGYVVVVDGTPYIGFATGLPESREPWTAGFLAFERDDVFDARDGILTEANDGAAETVRSVVDIAHEG